MATFVQKQTRLNNGVNATIALAGVAAGNTLILVVGTLDFTAAGGTLGVPTDTNGTWQVLVNPAGIVDGGGNRITTSVFYIPSALAGTHTVTAPMFGTAGNNQNALLLLEVKGPGIPTLDQSSTNNTTAAASTTTFNTGTTPALNGTNDFVVAGYCQGVSTGLAATGISDPPAGFISGTVNQNGVAGIPAELCYNTVTGTAGLIATWSFTANANQTSSVATIAVLKFPSGAQGDPSRPLGRSFRRTLPLSRLRAAIAATDSSAPASSPISGTAVATTVAVGAMDGSTGTLSGVAVATSDATGNLLGSGVLSGVSVATSNAVGSLALMGVLAGTSVATTAATGSLTGNGVLSGTSIATSIAAGNLIGSGMLSGVSVATSIGIGNLTNFTGGSISGTSVATTYGVGSVLASGFLSGVSVASSVAIGNLIGLGPLSGVSVATSNATGNLSGNGFLSGTSVVSSAAIGSLTGSGALSGVSVATSYGIGNLLNFNPGAISGVSVATTYGVGDLQGTGGGIQPAGRHRKRYAVVDGWRLLVFDSKKLADEAKAAIRARINPPTKNQRRKLKVRMPMPDLVIDLHHVQASADKIGQTNEFVELQGKRDAQSLLKLHEDIQAQDDEDVALSVAHVLADEDAQHAHLLKVIAMTTLLQRALRKT